MVVFVVVIVVIVVVIIIIFFLILILILKVSSRPFAGNIERGGGRQTDKHSHKQTYRDHDL